MVWDRRGFIGLAIGNLAGRSVLGGVQHVVSLVGSVGHATYGHAAIAYRPSALPAGQRGRYTLGGFTDATFGAMRVLEAGGNAGWPF